MVYFFVVRTCAESLPSSTAPWGNMPICVAECYTPLFALTPVVKIQGDELHTYHSHIYCIPTVQARNTVDSIQHWRLEELTWDKLAPTLATYQLRASVPYKRLPDTPVVNHVSVRCLVMGIGPEGPGVLRQSVDAKAVEAPVTRSFVVITPNKYK